MCELKKIFVWYTLTNVENRKRSHFEICQSVIDFLFIDFGGKISRFMSDLALIDAITSNRIMSLCSRSQ